MRYFLIATFLLLACASPAAAQMKLPPAGGTGKEGEILKKPICSWLTNRSEQTIMGFMATASQKVASGDVVKHRENFRLDAGQRKQFCAAGPFYEGQRLELTIRTIIPLFSCKTKIDREIFLDAKPEPGFTKLSATCY
jgi:hypothetical protein